MIQPVNGKRFEKCKENRRIEGRGTTSDMGLESYKTKTNPMENFKIEFFDTYVSLLKSFRKVMPLRYLAFLAQFWCLWPLRLSYTRHSNLDWKGPRCLTLHHYQWLAEGKYIQSGGLESISKRYSADGLGSHQIQSFSIRSDHMQMRYRPQKWMAADGSKAGDNSKGKNTSTSAWS